MLCRTICCSHTHAPWQSGAEPGVRNACIILAALAMLLASTSTAAAKDGRTKNPRVVRVIYVVPADAPVRDYYADRLRKAAEHLQIWYRNEVGDATTFTLHKPVVEVVQSSQVTSWYSTNPAGDNPDLWFFFNVVADAFALTGGGFFDPDNIWVFYVDSDPACGQQVGATSGVAVLPANDLRGLAGEPNIPPCPGQLPDTAGVCRWVGGLGHELGHAFGLPHPPACEDSDPATICPSDALLWLGYITYPNTYLLVGDKMTLRANPFFSRLPGRRSLPDCSDLSDRR
jgi:hypothetical protein